MRPGRTEKEGGKGAPGLLTSEHRDITAITMPEGIVSPQRGPASLQDSYPGSQTVWIPSESSFILK